MVPLFRRVRSVPHIILSRKLSMSRLSKSLCGVSPFLAFLAGMTTMLLLAEFNSHSRENPVSAGLRHGSASELRVNTPIHIIQAYCSYSWEFEHGHNGFTSVRSILMARENGRTRRRPYVFHIIVDDPVADAIRKGLNHTLPGSSQAAATLMNRWGDVLVYAAESQGLVQFKYVVATLIVEGNLQYPL